MRRNSFTFSVSQVCGLLTMVTMGGCGGTTRPPPVGPQTATVNEHAVVSDPSQPSRPVFVAVGPDRNIWFTEFDARSIGVLNLSTNAISHYPLPSPASNPTRIAMGPDGQLWFAETGPGDAAPSDFGANNNIGEISVSGEIKEFRLPMTDSDPAGVVLGPDGNVWFTEAATGDVRQITAGGKISDPFPAGTVTSMPAGIVTGPDANLWFTESSADKLGMLTLAGKLTEFPLPATGSSPTEIVAGADGKLWFSESSKDKIGRVSTAGVIDEFITPTGNSVPAGATLGPDCNIWFTESNANLIGRIDSAGNITEFKIPTANSQPSGIALGPDGNLWFAESAANQIAELIPPSGSSTACSRVDLPPAAKCQSAKVSTDAGACTAASASIDNGSFDPQNLTLTESTSPAGPYHLGNTEVTLTARRSPLIASACAANVEVDDAEPPKITCPTAVVAECTSPAGAPVTLTPTANDNCPAMGEAVCAGSGSTFALGTTLVTCSVTDGSHNTSSCTASVNVRDTVPPAITSVSASPATLWPPNHKQTSVTISVSATDACDPSVASRCSIVGVTSNQTSSAGAFQVTGPRTVVLAAERDGSGARNYIIQVKCSDVSGNSSLGTTIVTVPHDQGNS